MWTLRTPTTCRSRKALAASTEVSLVQQTKAAADQDQGVGAEYWFARQKQVGRGDFCTGGIYAGKPCQCYCAAFAWYDGDLCKGPASAAAVMML
jgi:hypothetical protein